MLIDEVSIKVNAGNGGKGVAAFNKSIRMRGPTGGNGGRGGNVYFEGISDLGALTQFRYKKKLAAKNGKDGMTKLMDGASGEDLIVKIPLGTVVNNLSTGGNFEITKVGEKTLVAKGGIGGKGNYFFRSSTNTTPLQSQPGRHGDQYDFRLEMKLIADIGFIGLPNVGKSSLLNGLTNARSKVANYPFTTLEPSLGVYYELILADIPGLIEGASKGKGLGIKFLRHVERTGTLFHFISAESFDPKADYGTVRNEIGKYNKHLLEKEEYLILSKSDLNTPEEVEGKLLALKELNPKVLAISIYDPDSLKEVTKILNTLAKEKRV